MGTGDGLAGGTRPETGMKMAGLDVARVADQAETYLGKIVLWLGRDDAGMAGEPGDTAAIAELAFGGGDSAARFTRPSL